MDESKDILLSFSGDERPHEAVCGVDVFVLIDFVCHVLRRDVCVSESHCLHAQPGTVDGMRQQHRAHVRRHAHRSALITRGGIALLPPKSPAVCVRLGSAGTDGCRNGLMGRALILWLSQDDAGQLASRIDGADLISGRADDGQGRCNGVVIAVRRGTAAVDDRISEVEGPKKGHQRHQAAVTSGPADMLNGRQHAVFTTDVRRRRCIAAQ
mmetsp:Transcript_25062/g.62028  ORF Transcript_25062/g.62028 Transcript_25062/m.62028 type:complete len:211 (-) Transcript_25062:343-975(-)